MRFIVLKPAVLGILQFKKPPAYCNQWESSQKKKIASKKIYPHQKKNIRIKKKLKSIKNMVKDKDFRQREGKEGRREGRKEGRREGGKEGMQEGRKEGRKGGRKEGMGEEGKEGRKGGRKKGMGEEGKEGRKEGRKEEKNTGRKKERKGWDSLSDFFLPKKARDKCRRSRQQGIKKENRKKQLCKEKPKSGNV